MHNKMLRLAATALLAISAILPATAQNTAMSPYSRYGYGLLNDNVTSTQRAMGGVGYAMNSGRQINVMNPASYAMMDSLTFLFDMGVTGTSQWSSENKQREQRFGGGLDYITMQVPITRGLGASLGLLPYSSVGYSFGNEITNGSVSRTGNGGLNQLYLGVGGSPFKGFGVGVNMAYFFGSISNTLYATAGTASTSLFEHSLSVRDWRLDIGAQYTLRLGAKDAVTLGVVYSPSKKLHGDVYGIYYDTSSSTAVPDTVAGSGAMNGRFTTPETWGAGINWRRGQSLMFEADFTYQPWSKAKFASVDGFESTKFANRYRGSIGAQYLPAVRGGYLSRIQYRAGMYYNRDYVMVMGNNVRDLGVTLGLGLPVPGFKSTVNIGIEYRNRQATPNPLIKENSINLSLGVNFNEMWFRKNKLH